MLRPIFALCEICSCTDPFVHLLHSFHHAMGWILRTYGYINTKCDKSVWIQQIWKSSATKSQNLPITIFVMISHNTADYIVTCLSSITIFIVGECFQIPLPPVVIPMFTKDLWKHKGVDFVTLWSRILKWLTLLTLYALKLTCKNNCLFFCK